MAINITADPINIYLTPYAIYSIWPANPRDADLDTTFDCNARDLDGYSGIGIPRLEVSLTGEWFNLSINAEPIDIILTQVGEFPIGFLHTSESIDITVTPSITSMGLITQSIKSNWVKWSDIGNLDFTINRNNIAGERPLDWSGWIYEIKKLNAKVVVYGQNGISFLLPTANTFGLQTFSHIGIMGKQAVTGTDDVHFFIDVTGRLYQLDTQLTKLDFSEYLSVLTNPVMTYDIDKQLIYICDGTYGFVYSIDSKSLGEGPVNICGLGNYNADLYVTAPDEIITPAFEICTDIIDFGSRKDKTIHTIEFGTDLTEFLFASIDVRSDYRNNFMNIGWFPVTPEGIAYINCFGKEFKIRVKVLNYEYLELDYIKIKGNVHRSSPIDI